MACAQDHIFLPPLSDAHRVHHCWYVFMRCPARCTINQIVIYIGVAFFDSAWSQSVCRSFLHRNVNPIFFRRVEPFSFLSPYAPRSSWPHVPVRLFATTVAAVMTISSVVHTIRIHGIYDKSRSVLYGMGLLLAFQVVVTGICCAFYRCEFCFPSLLVSGPT
jgi:hypothetical protein